MPPRIDVGPIGEMHDYWGKRLSRPIAPEALRSALVRYFRDPENRLWESMSQMAGGQPVRISGIRSVKASHFQEGDFQHIFQVRVNGASTGRRCLAMVVAKNEGLVSGTAADEFRNLKRLHHRQGRYVVRPLAGGTMSLEPDAAGQTQTVFIYFTEWLHGFHELGVDRQLNFFINEKPFHYFDRRVSDILRAQVLKILFSCYDAGSRKAMAPPKIGAGDFVITRPRPGRPYDLKLIACRKIFSGVTPGQCLRLYLGYHGTWGGRIFHLLPRDHRLLHRAIWEGLVLTNPDRISGISIHRELKAFADDLTGGRWRSEAWNPMAAIRPLLRTSLWTGSASADPANRDLDRQTARHNPSSES
ncbi:MAG: hypothetical protein ACOWWM_16660 [Desulfobacterales bacterium]